MPQPILLDGDNVAKRCILATALDDLKAGGQFTGGIYGTLGMLSSLLMQPEIRAAGVYAFFDHGVPPRRLKLIPGYKSDRKARREMFTEEQKEKVFSQVALIREMLTLLGCVVARYKDREADDTCAAAARLFRADSQIPIVVSGDHDLLQTVRMGAEVWNLTSKMLIDDKNFAEQMGVPPSLFLLYKTLKGDNSDSIDGVAGCGEAKAAEMVLAYAADLDAEARGAWDVGDEVPLEQLAGLVHWLRTKPKLKQVEQAVIDAYPRIHKEMQGIDLAKSFGPTDTLAVRLQCAPKPDKMGFLRFCKRLGMSSILGSPDRYFRPFLLAAERRDALLASRATVS